ncbi:MAG: hypothetical protein ACN6PN_00010, partial [Sphingobacterium sp.]
KQDLNSKHLSSNIAGCFIFRLPPGNYKIRLIIDGQFTDNDIHLDHDMRFVFGEPEQSLQGLFYVLRAPDLYSSVPLRGKIPYASSFDYYTDAAVRISSEPSFKLSNDNTTDSGLFIFLRYSSAGTFQKQFKSRAYWKRFRLFDSLGNLLVRFPDGAVTHSVLQSKGARKHGYLGFSANLPPGLYFFNYAGNQERFIPIYVYKNWYSQVFMTLDKEPLFGSLKMLIDKKLKFDPKNIKHTYVDICLSKLQNRDYYLDHELLHTIAMGKFESPMLGLLGAYIYLMGNETKDDLVFRTIVQNLKNKIFDQSDSSADIFALDILSQKHFDKTFVRQSSTRVNGTPMLRIGFDTIRYAAAEQKDIILQGSLNDSIAEKQFFDSAFNTFASIGLLTERKHLISTEGLEDKFNLWDNNFIEFNRIDAEFIEGTESNFFQEFLKPERDISKKSNLGYINFKRNLNYLSIFQTDKTKNQKKYSSRDKLEGMLSRKTRRVGIVTGRIIVMVLDDPMIDSATIAKSLNVPLSTVDRLRNTYKIYLPG